MLFNILPYTEFDKALQVYVIPGKPIPLQRPRYSVAHVYDSQKREKAGAAIHLACQHNDQELFSGALQLNVEFYFKTPLKTNSLNGHYHTARPDTDNLVKWICDISQGILYKEDSIIAQIIATKLYDHTPRTEFTLRPLK
jgi:Holliday junction resolvase RusA-like endonuclease